MEVETYAFGTESWDSNFDDQYCMSYAGLRLRRGRQNAKDRVLALHNPNTWPPTPRSDVDIALREKTTITTYEHEWRRISTSSRKYMQPMRLMPSRKPNKAPHTPAPPGANANMQEAFCQQRDRTQHINLTANNIDSSPPLGGDADNESA